MIINGRALLVSKPIKDMFDYKQKHRGVSFGLSEAGYDIRLKQGIHFEPRQKLITIYDGDTEQLRHGNFTIASAIEEFDMPNNLVGIVHDKSTWARKGLSVFNTVIEPGWKGFLTLELVYNGDIPLYIPAGSGIAQVIFHETVEDSSYSGKYQNQQDMPVESIFDN